MSARSLALVLSLVALAAGAVLPAEASSPTAPVVSGRPAATTADDAADQQPAVPPPGPGRPQRPRTTPAQRPVFEVKGFGLVGYTGFIASDTFEAVLDSAGGPVYGGGAMVGHRSGWFAQAAFERFSREGERVFVHDGEVFELGIPLTVTVMPIEFTGGFRFLPKPRAPTRPVAQRPRRPIFQPARPRPEDETPPPPPPQAAPPPARTWVPYVGGGVGRVLYEESADFAEPGDDLDESFTSYHVLAGVDGPIHRWLGAGVEFGYRWVPDALGSGGASEAFDENDLGGFAIRLRITVGN